MELTPEQYAEVKMYQFREQLIYDLQNQNNHARRELGYQGINVGDELKKLRKE